MLMEAGEQFARELANQFVGFQDQLEPYLDDGDDGFAYVFLAIEVTPELVDAYIASTTGRAVALDWRALLRFLDEWLGRGDPVVDNVIKASFLLQLPNPGSPGRGIVAELPERLERTLRTARPDS
jgi:hypothetical protein